MRIAAFADTHQLHDGLVVPDADVVVCAGDVCRRGDRDELDAFLGWFSALPHRRRLFVAGNHDGCLETQADEVRRRHPGVTFLQDDGVTVDGVSFWGSPWTPRFHDWFFMLERGPALAARWALIPEGVDVLITHGPPKGILDDVGGPEGGAVPTEDERFVGCADLRARVRVVRPRVHLFGHIHSCRGVVDEHGTRFVNCTTDECALPVSVVDVEPRPSRG